MSYIYGDRFGPEWALRHDGQKKTAPMGVALAPELRAVGSLCGGVCAACGGVAPWGWRCSGLPDAPRRVAVFWCGRAGPPRPGMPTDGISRARGAVGIFV